MGMYLLSSIRGDTGSGGGLYTFRLSGLSEVSISGKVEEESDVPVVDAAVVRTPADGNWTPPPRRSNRLEARTDIISNASPPIELLRISQSVPAPKLMSLRPRFCAAVVVDKLWRRRKVAGRVWLFHILFFFFSFQPSLEYIPLLYVTLPSNLNTPTNTTERPLRMLR